MTKDEETFVLVFSISQSAPYNVNGCDSVKILYKVLSVNEYPPTFQSNSSNIVLSEDVEIPFTNTQVHSFCYFNLIYLRPD